MRAVLNKEGENSAYSGWFNPADDPNNYAPLNVRDEIASIEHIMMYDDAASNWGHRDTIMNKQYTRGKYRIAYDNKRLALVQQFDEEICGLLYRSHRQCRQSEPARQTEISGCLK